MTPSNHGENILETGPRAASRTATETTKVEPAAVSVPEIATEFEFSPNDEQDDSGGNDKKVVHHSQERVMLASLQQELEELTRRFNGTRRQLATYLAERPTATAVSGDQSDWYQKLSAQLADIRGDVQRVAETLESRVNDAPEPSTSDSVEQVLAACKATRVRVKEACEIQISEGNKAAEKLQESLSKEIQAAVKQIVDTLAPPEEDTPDDSVALEAWLYAIFGDVLPREKELRPRLDDLCERLLTNASQASILIGHLLIFRHISPARRPQLLKELGEAYYDCFPKSVDAEDPFEIALATWLQNLCAQAGFQNTIELVHPGERLDATRHIPREKGGVEISQVHGWIVLGERDNVYTKAIVSVR